MNSKALKITNLALALAVIAIACYLLLYSPDNSELETPNKLEQNSVNTIKTTIDDSQNAQTETEPVTSKLFQSETQTVTKTDNSENVAKLPDFIELKGTITGPENIARAIIKTKSEGPDSPDTFIKKIGDNIEGFSIVEIHKDHIVLSSNGKTAQLWIAQNRSMLNSSKTETNTQRSPTNETVELEMPKTFQENYNMLESLAKDCDWTIATDQQNNALGITLENVKTMTPLALAGLQNGDIVKTINNQKLTSLQKTFQVLQKARVQDKLEIEVIRNGQTHNFESVLQKTTE